MLTSAKGYGSYKPGAYLTDSELVPEPKKKFSVATEYRLPGAIGTVGFISALSNHFCAECNKIRLTSDGKIKPCLHSNEEIPMKPVLMNGTRRRSPCSPRGINRP